KRSSSRQGVVGGANQLHLLLQIPVVENHSHRDEVGLGQWVLEEVTGGGANTFSQASHSDRLTGNRFNGRQVKGNALQVRVFPRGLDAEKTRGAAHVAKRLVR